MTATFEPANLLEIALKNAATDPAARPVFLRELLESKVLIVSAGEKPTIVDGVIPGGSQLSIEHLEFRGRNCVPFYTSEARLPAGTQCLTLDAKALFEITRGAHLILNPGMSYGKEFFPEEVAGLLDGSAFMPKDSYVAQKATQVLIGQPKDYPKELVEALARLYAKAPAVQRAWVAFYHNPDRDAEGGLLIALDVPDEKEMARMSGESGIVIESVRKTQKFVDLIRYEKTGVAGYFTDVKPFYQKSAMRSWWSKLTS